MKNILIISNYAAPYRGNFIPALETIENHYSSGKVFYLFPSVANTHSWMRDFALHHEVWLEDRNIFSKNPQFTMLIHLKKKMQENDIAIVHTHFVEGNINMFLLKQITSAKFIANLHNHYIVSGRMGAMRKWLFKHTNDIVIGDSKSVSESAFAIGIPQDKVVTILNSIQFSRLDTFTKHFFNNSGDKTLLMFSYPWYRKGVDVVVKAVEKMRKSGERIQVKLAQVGDISMTKHGIEQAIGYIPEWIEFLPPIDTLADYYNSVDVFISAGREEGLSYSPIEAAYCECGVICSNIGGNPLDIPQIGIYETEDIDALVACLQKELHLSDGEKQHRNNAQREYVLKHYNVEDWAKKIINLYLNNE